MAAVRVRLVIRVAVRWRVVHESVQHAVPAGRRADLEEQHERTEERLEVEHVVDSVHMLHLISAYMICHSCLKAY